MPYIPICLYALYNHRIYLYAYMRIYPYICPRGGQGVPGRSPRSQISTHKSPKFVPNLFKMVVLSSHTTKIEVPERNIDQEDAADPILRVPGGKNGVRGPNN